MENHDDKENELLACPSCGTDVNEDANTCPECGAVFEKENQNSNPTPLKREELKITSQEEKPQNEKTQEPLEHQVNASLESENEIQNDNVQMHKEERVSDLPVSLQGLHRYKKKSNLNQESEDKSFANDKKILNALKEYSENRKKRYTMGTMFLGLGVVLFVMLWLVVVYDVLVTETTQWFGAHIVLILVAAGIFFTSGLFIILTYPKSSLIDVITYMSESKQQKKSSEN